MSPEPGISPFRRPLFARLFLSPDEPRLRAGWRLLIQSVLALAFLLAASLPVTLLLLFTGGAGLGQLQSSALLNASISLAGIVLSVWVARRFLDRRSFSSLGLVVNARAARDLLAGVAITAVMMGAILLLELAAGWTRIES